MKFLNVLKFLNEEYKWFKSFFEEDSVYGRKASQKRLSSFLVIVTFLYSYLTVLLKKTWEIQDISKVTLPDIPTMWATLIGVILGFNIFSNSVNNKQATNSIEIKKEEVKNETTTV